MTDFTNAQRETLEKMVNTAINLRVLRENPSAGDLGSIPDITKAEAIAAEAAKKAINDFKESLKPWWKLRDRRDSQIAVGGLAALILFGVLDRVTNDAALMRQVVHWMAGTEQVIETEMTSALTDWANGPKLKPGVVLQDGFKQRIDALADDTVFQDRMGTALFTQASNRKPEFVQLIDDILDSQPTVMFQGQAILGGSDTAIIPNPECRSLLSHWFSRAPQILPSDLLPPNNTSIADPAYNDALNAVFKRFCPTLGIVSRKHTLEVPFWARLRPGTNAESDKVRVLVQIDPVTRTPMAHMPYDVWKAPKPMTLIYSNSRDHNDGFKDFPLSPEKTNGGTRFFLAEIGNGDIQSLPEPKFGTPGTSDVLHSVEVTLPDYEEGEVCGTPEGSVPYFREILVRVMVVVNRPVH